jgi:hypothetical protein
MSGGYRGQYWEKQQKAWGSNGYNARNNDYYGGDYQKGSPRFDRPGWKGGGTGGGPLDKVAELLANREIREMEEKEAAAKVAREEKDRVAALWAQEQAKKERDDLKEEIKEQQKAFFKQFSAAGQTPRSKKRL